jgi:hypothetical protein
MQAHTCVTLLMLAITLTHAHSECIQIKGNLLFTELGRKSLNQEYVSFVRSLNTSDLRLIATYLRQSIDLYHSFCDQVKTTLELTQNKTKKFHSVTPKVRTGTFNQAPKITLEMPLQSANPLTHDCQNCETLRTFEDCKIF